MNANESMRGWYPDPFGRYDERYFIDGQFTDRARVFLGTRARAFYDPIPGAYEIDGLEHATEAYEDEQRAGVIQMVLVGIGAACIIAAFYLGAFAHVTVGDIDSIDCGTAFSPSTTLSTARTHQCNSAGLTANRTLAIVIGLLGVGLIGVAIWRRVGTGGITLWSNPRPMDALSEDLLDAGATRTCPWCAETIKSAAVICRFCGRIAPSAPDPVTDTGVDGYVFDPRRGAWTRADVASTRTVDPEPPVELPARPTPLLRAPAASAPDVIDVDEE